MAGKTARADAMLDMVLALRSVAGGPRDSGAMQVKGESPGRAILPVNHDRR